MKAPTSTSEQTPEELSAEQDGGVSRSAPVDFYARGEAAWNEYLRTGVSYSVDEVFDRMQLRTDAKRRELMARS